jgi:hypothetical protein
LYKTSSSFATRQYYDSATKLLIAINSSPYIHSTTDLGVRLLRKSRSRCGRSRSGLRRLQRKKQQRRVEKKITYTPVNLVDIHANESSKKLKVIGSRHHHHTYIQTYKC